MITSTIMITISPLRREATTFPSIFSLASSIRSTSILESDSTVSVASNEGISKNTIIQVKIENVEGTVY